VDFLHNNTLGKTYAWKNVRTVQMYTYNFQSELHDDAKTWADEGTLKVKYPVNAENFKRIL
jgi:hypothetical protein